MNPRDLLTMSPIGVMLHKINTLDGEQLTAWYQERAYQGRPPEPGENEALARRERELRAAKTPTRRNA